MPATGPTYPVSLTLGGRPCLVVGGGRVAARKVTGLLRSGAAVTVVAPDTCAELDGLDLVVHRRAYRVGEATAYYLVISATGVPDVDEQVARDCEAAGVLVNVADDPVHCNFLLPAVLGRGPVTVAVSTTGASPALAVALRDEIGGLIGPSVGDLAELLGAIRSKVQLAGRPTEGLDWAGLIATVRPLIERDPDSATALAERWLDNALGGA